MVETRFSRHISSFTHYRGSDQEKGMVEYLLEFVEKHKIM